MTKAKMEQLIRFRKNVEHVMAQLEKIEEASKLFTQEDGITRPYVDELRMYGGAPLRMIKMLHMRVEEVEKQQRGTY